MSLNTKIAFPNIDIRKDRKDIEKKLVEPYSRLKNCC